MRQNRDIIVIGCLFFAIGLLLQVVGFWSAIGLPEPRGFFIQGGLFMGLMLLLRNLVFEPFLQIDQARTDETKGKRLDAQDKQNQAMQMMQEYDSAIINAKIKAETTKQEIAMDAEAQERKTLEHARQVSDENLKKELKTIHAQAMDVEKDLQKNIPLVATEIFNNVFSKDGSKRI